MSPGTYGNIRNPQKGPGMNIPSWLKASLITSAQTLAASVLVVLLDVLFDVQDWVQDPTNKVDLSGAGTAALVALVTFATGVVTAVYRKLNPPEASYNQPPS